MVPWEIPLAPFSYTGLSRQLRRGLPRIKLWIGPMWHLELVTLALGCVGQQTSLCNANYLVDPAPHPVSKVPTTPTSIGMNHRETIPNTTLPFQLMRCFDLPFVRGMSWLRGGGAMVSGVSPDILPFCQWGICCKFRQRFHCCLSFHIQIWTCNVDPNKDRSRYTTQPLLTSPTSAHAVADLPRVRVQCMWSPQPRPLHLYLCFSGLSNAFWFDVTSSYFLPC